MPRNSFRITGRDSSRNALKPVLNPAQRQESAFLVGVEFRTSRRGAGKTASASLTTGAQAARDHATSTATALPADTPDFSPKESLDELRALATSAGARTAGEFMQRRDRPDPATLIGKGKLEEIAGAFVYVKRGADV